MCVCVCVCVYVSFFRLHIHIFNHLFSDTCMITLYSYVIFR